LIYNFYLNDRFTFRSLIDSRRTWVQRLMRFHVPAMVGFVLTLAISSGLWTFVRVNGDHFSPTLSQAIAIVFVTGVNFVMHRFWTYREVRH
jgi:putative flippase GtrA